jgi:DNA repair protein RadA/Sms
MKEAAKLGFNQALAPAAASEGASVRVAGVSRLAEAVSRVGDGLWP